MISAEEWSLSDSDEEKSIIVEPSRTSKKTNEAPQQKTQQHVETLHGKLIQSNPCPKGQKEFGCGESNSDLLGESE